MAQATKQAATKPQPKAADKQPVKLIFDKSNYRWFIISIAVVVFGFILMAGTTDIYSNTKIVLAPIVVLTGFAIGFFAILKKPEAK
jgi:bacteriorhodopsin